MKKNEINVTYSSFFVLYMLEELVYFYIVNNTDYFLYEKGHLCLYTFK